MQVDGARVREPTINNLTLKDLVISFDDFTDLTFFEGFKKIVCFVSGPYMWVATETSPTSPNLKQPHAICYINK